MADELRGRSATVISVGGPALTYYLMPTEDELRARYNPDLRKQSLEQRDERQQEFDKFVSRLKDYSKSDKPSLSLPPPPCVDHERDPVAWTFWREGRESSAAKLP